MATLNSVAQLGGHHSTKQKVTNSLPGQGTCLGAGLDPGQDAYKRQLINVSPSHQCFSPFLSPSLPLFQ